MKTGLDLKLVSLVGLVFVIFLFPYAFVNGAKLQSGVTIKATESTPNDQCVNGVDAKGDPCGGVKAPAEPPGKCVDANQDGADDNTGAACTPLTCVNGADVNTGAACTPQTTPAEGTCGLKIMGGVPINYGELSIGQESGERMVSIMNEGTSQTPAKVMIKGQDWLSDELSLGSHIKVAGPEVTRVSLSQSNYDGKTPLSSNGMELGQMKGGESLGVNFQLKLVTPPVGTPAGGAVGAFHQDVTVDLLC